VKVVVAGGAGFIGSHVAARLAGRGDAVTVMTRRPASENDPSAIDGMPRLLADYTSDALAADLLEGFDTVVFAAGNDIRHVAAHDEDAAFWDRVQAEGVPRFAALAKRAGVGRFVQVGSYYHQLHPEWADTIPYVAARKAADDGARALTDETFAAITLNPPSIVGVPPGRGLRRFGRMIAWVRGELAEPELFAPTGGTNYMSMHSLAQAVEGAIDAGVPGHAYLIGDENLTYRDYFQQLADAAGSRVRIEERDEEHPYQPDRFIVQGRGSVIAYQPPVNEVEQLGYDRLDVRRALEEIVRASDAELP
jgi:nucleoside-diphosphate-sugar epimerase